MNAMTIDEGSRAAGSVDRLAQSAHQAVDRAVAKAVPAMDQVRAVADQATETVHAKLDQLSAMQDEWTGSIRDQVRAHPLTVVGLAVLTGVLLGRVLR
jgi:ElaB/YqjD/DUF883 family membrane-anchored ribosome-binding protein